MQGEAAGGAGAGAGTGAGAREDAPLRARARAACGARGPRLLLASFAALSAAITLALFTQIYSGDYEVVPHGAAASGAAACSRAGTDALKAGGRALDAAAAAALCLAVLAPHRTSLDASGSLLYWEYRQRRAREPLLAEWGGPGAGRAGGAGRAPRLLAALAALHAELGALPWRRVLQPAVDLARDGFPVSESLAAALAEAGAAGGAAPAPGSLRAAPALAAYLQSLQHNTSAELSLAWGGGALRRAAPARAAAGAGWLYVGGPQAARAQAAVAAALDPPPAGLDEAQLRVVSALSAGAGAAGAEVAAEGVASGLAVVDRLDTYLALVTGLSQPLGSGPASGAGWAWDAPAAPLDLAPAILIDQHVCGTRYVLGGESGAALAQAAAALGAGGGAAAVERARAPLAPRPARPARPEPAVNLVQQAADALLSHADSRAGGLGSRF